MPNDAPSEGSRRQSIAFLPIWLSASVRPTVVVVLPSPAGVGVIAVTRISLPFGLLCSDLMKSIDALALYVPYGSRFSAGVASFFFAISRIGRFLAACEISMSDFGL